MNGLTPETLQLLVQRKILTPEQAQKAIAAQAQSQQQAGAVLNGQPTNVAGDAVLGTQGNLGSGLPAIGRPVDITNNMMPPSSMMRPEPSASPAPPSTAPASLNGQPVDTVGDLSLAPPKGGLPQGPQGFSQALGAQGLALPSAPPPPQSPLTLQMQPGSQLPPATPFQPFPSAPTAPPKPESLQSVRNTFANSGAIMPPGQFEDPSLIQSRMTKAGALPPPKAQPPTPAQQADLHFRQNTPSGSQSGQGSSIPMGQVNPAHTVSLVDPEVSALERQGLGEERAGRVGEAQGAADAVPAEAQALGNQAGSEMIGQVGEESKARHLRWLGEQHAQEMDKDRLELEKAKPDYNRVFRGKPVMGFLAAIAQGFGAVGAGLTHGPNYAANIISDFVDRDVAQQKADYEHKKDSLAAKQSIYAEKMKLLGDPNAAEEAAKAHGYNATMLLAKREAALANSPVLQARVTSTAGLMDQKIAQATSAMQQRVQSSVMGAGGANPKTQDQKLFVPRAGGFALREKDAQELGEAGSGYAKIDSLTKEALALHQQIGLNPVKDYEIYKRLHQIKNELQPAVQETNNFKRLSAEDEKINADMIGGIDSIMPGAADRVAKFRADKLAEEQTKYATAGVGKGAEGYTRNAAGEIVRAGRLAGEDYRAPRSLPARKAEE